MSENAADIGMVAAELSDIKSLLVAVLVVTIVSACVAILRFSSASLRNLISIWDDFFREEAKRLLDGNEVDGVIRLAKAKLVKKPNHVYAHWYLARAYYVQEKWAESLAAFREVERLDPSWIENHVKPYVDEIERKTIAATLH
jgi:cytochrome c-type biogenesis protein CcmH/NrfG